MTLKKVTREEALKELEELEKEMDNWGCYLDFLALDYMRTKDGGAPEEIINRLDLGIKEGILKMQDIQEAYEAQKKYCKQRGWI